MQVIMVACYCHMQAKCFRPIGPILNQKYNLNVSILGLICI